MSGISDIVTSAIYQISCTFICPIGNPEKRIMGTGFFVNNDVEVMVFITNKHNLDPSLKLGENTTYKLSAASIYLRKNGPNNFVGDAKWVGLDISSIIHSENSDISVIYKFPTGADFLRDFNNYRPSCFGMAELADGDYFNKNISMMDMASFIGFPGSGNAKWWDTESNSPISRMTTIASSPKKSFKNPSILTDEVILVNGLSFSGSSGSPIFSHEKGIKIQGTPGQIEITNTNYTPPKIIGIMSGHWWENSTPEMFNHSGLSYFTKSTSIIELIRGLR